MSAENRFVRFKRIYVLTLNAKKINTRIFIGLFSQVITITLSMCSKFYAEKTIELKA